MTHEAWPEWYTAVASSQERLDSYDAARLVLMQNAANVAGYLLLPSAMMSMPPRNSVKVRDIGQVISTEAPSLPDMPASRNKETPTDLPVYASPESAPRLRPGILSHMEERLDDSILPRLREYAGFTLRMDFGPGAKAHNFNPDRVRSFNEKLAEKGIELNDYEITEQDLLLIIADTYKRKIKLFPNRYDDGAYPDELFDKAKFVEFALGFLQCPSVRGSVSAFAGEYGVKPQLVSGTFIYLLRLFSYKIRQYEATTGRPAFELSAVEEPKAVGDSQSLSHESESQVSKASQPTVHSADTAIITDPTLVRSQVEGEPSPLILEIAAMYGQGVAGVDIARAYSKSVSYVTQCAKKTIAHLQDNPGKDPHLLSQLLARYRPQKSKTATNKDLPRDSDSASRGRAPRKKSAPQVKPKAVTDTHSDKDLDIDRLYIKYTSKMPLLSAAEEVELAQRIEAGLFADRKLKEADAEKVELDSTYRQELEWIASNGVAAKDHLTCANLRLVIKHARRREGEGVSFLDLAQEGNLALIRAVEKFDYTKGYRFSTYADKWIRKFIDEAVRDQGSSLRLSKETTEVMRKVGRVRRELIGQSLREPTEKELAAASQLPLRKVKEVLRYLPGVMSLDSPVDDHGYTLAETVEERKDAFEAPEEVSERLQRIEALLATILDKTEMTIFYRNYGLDGGKPMQAEEIAQELQISERSVKYKITTALKKIRQSTHSDELVQLLR